MSYGLVSKILVNSFIDNGIEISILNVVYFVRHILKIVSGI